MSLWVKWWCDALDDPKLMRAARKGATQLILLPWILLFAKRADDDGRLTVNGEPIEAEDIARSLPGVTTADVATALSDLEKIGVLARNDRNILFFVAWEVRAANRPSDSHEAVRERVRLHRERKAASRDELGRHSDETRRNALHHIEGNADVTTQSGERRAESKSERQSEDGERAVAETASSSLAQRLPPAAIELLGHIQSAKQSQVSQEMQQVLNGGCAYRRQRVRASADRLEAKCRESLVSIAGGRVRTPEKAWAFTLAKLADTSDGSAPGAVAAVSDQAGTLHDVREQVQADEWIRSKPDVARAIDARLDHDGYTSDGPAATSRRIVRNSLVLEAWRESRS